MNRRNIVILSSWSSKVVQISVQIISLKLLSSIFDPNQFSLFMILAGLSAWTVLTDFGVGTAYQNRSSYAYAVADDLKFSTDLFSSLKISIGIMTISLAVLAIVYANYQILFPHYAESLDLKLGTIAYLFFLLASAQVSIIYKHYFSVGRGYISNAAQAAASMSGLIGVFIYSQAVHSDINSSYIFLQVVALWSAPIFIIPFILLARLVVRTSKLLPKKWDKKSLEILKQGRSFFIFNFLSTCVLSFEFFLLSQSKNVEEVVEYTFLLRMFVPIQFLYSAILLAIWPEMSKYDALGTREKIDKLIQLYLPIGWAVTLFLGGIFFLFSSEITKFLLSDQNINVSGSLILCFIFFSLLRVWSDTFATSLQSRNIMKPLLIILPFQALISVGFQIIFFPSLGTQAFVIGKIISFLVTTVWILPIIHRRSIKS